MFQNQVHPLLHKGRTAVPIQGMLKDNDIMVQKQGLLLSYIDIKIRVSLIKIMESNTNDLPGSMR
jgi:hypothetical protein